MTNKPNRPVVIWDIDGVLADDRLRAQAFLACTDQFAEPRSLELRKECDWDGYYGAIGDDLPHADMVSIFKAMHWHNSAIATEFLGTTEAQPVFLTGRDETYRKETTDWLKYHVHPFAGTDMAPLYMRREGSTLTNKEEKEHHLEDIKLKWGVPTMAFEDNDATVKFYRERGIRCLQPTRAVPSGTSYKS